MPAVRKGIALLVCLAVTVCFANDEQANYKVKYSGGSLPTVKGGDDLRMFLDADRVRLKRDKKEAASIPASAITEVNYGQEVHRRIGTAAGLAVVSLGIGALVAFSKSKKHYVGIVWDAGDGKKGGIALQVDKDEFRGLILALEGMTGKKAVDTDALTEAAAKSGLGQPVPVPVASATPATTTVTVPPPSAQGETARVTPVNTAPAPVASPQVVPIRTTIPTPAVSARVESIQATPSTPAQVRAEPVRVMPTATPAVPPSKPLPTVQATFASNPPGAVVSCNGTTFGRTPFLIPLLPGVYLVKFELAGYPDWTTEITVETAKPFTLVAQLSSTTGVMLK